MSLPSLTGAQKTRLRSLGQTMPDTLQIGRDGAAETIAAVFEREFARRELVKVRFTGGQDRHQRAALHESLAASTGSLCVGAVGHTALFWRPHSDPAKQLLNAAS